MEKHQITTPMDWLKINISNPAYIWIGGILVITTSSYLSGYLTHVIMSRMEERE